MGQCECSQGECRALCFVLWSPWRHGAGAGCRRAGEVYLYVYTLRWGELQEALVMGYQGEGFMKTFGGQGKKMERSLSVAK